ncbi:AbiV family abortive infection protein [Mucilaginibacter sabulilitoris]|uniref:AbiV family abortive infection protein n=1 Tax=Mucilaginibacter sabulilitoris TaxID=1173583 RepID=A0ABZ0TJX8_9SPHI|nr:AbiV family abortive infection protein [Mucilaginibacter sabulilitoris]WPU92498.1 AbiV family abortive infection protein [Mucilaginibacter sabulilitoris]
MNDKELEKGFSMVIGNAQSLFDEATLLFANGYFARSYSLSQLAIEEVGKSTLLCRAVLAFYMGEEVNSKYLDKLGFRDHQQKTRLSLKSELISVYLYEKSIDEKTDFRGSIIDVFSRVDKLNSLKNESLYVSMVDDKFSVPSEIISSDMAKELLEKAELRLVSAKPLLRPLTDMKLSALRLKEIMNDPNKHAEFQAQASKELGIEFTE